MTGFQPHPGVKKKNGEAVDIYEVVKGCGVDSVSQIDPYDLKKALVVFSDAIAYKGLSVVVSRHSCALVETRNRIKRGEEILPYFVDPADCIKCYTCTSEFGCPASWKGGDDYPRISPTLCVGCGVCAEVCPTRSIKPISEKEESQ
jgi:indolepyruvate ferredoxin oxidoreductase alpha subunit